MTRQSRGLEPSAMAAGAGEEVELRLVGDSLEGQEDTPKELTWRGKLQVILNSNPVQYGIIVLVVLDSLIVMFELLIDIGVIVIPEPEPVIHNTTHAFNESLLVLEHAANASSNVTEHVVHHVAHHGHDVIRRWAEAAKDHVSHGVDHVVEHVVVEHHDVNHTSNDTWHNATHHNDTHGEHGEHEEHAHHHTNKEKVEHAMHYASLAILVVFVIEVIAKLLAEGTHFFKHKAEVFDALIVVVSFSLDIAFMFASVSSAVQDAAGLMVLLRLWRVTRIINGVIMSVKKEADKKINELKTARAKAEEEVTRLQGLLANLENEVVALKERLLSQENAGDQNGDGDANSGIGLEERNTSLDANPDTDLGYQETSFDVLPDTNPQGSQGTPAETNPGSSTRGSMTSSVVPLENHQDTWDAFEGGEPEISSFVPQDTSYERLGDSRYEVQGTSVDGERLRSPDDADTST